MNRLSKLIVLAVTIVMLISLFACTAAPSTPDTSKPADTGSSTADKPADQKPAFYTDSV